MKLVVLLVFALLLVSCETPQGDASGLNSSFLSPGQNGSIYSNALNDHMRGPAYNAARAGCPTGVFDPNVETVHFPLRYNDRPSGSLNGEPQVQWDECNRNLRANYIGKRGPAPCKSRKVSREFINFFDENFSACAQKAYASMQGQDEVDLDGLSFGHKGITGDTNHTSRSYHSVNRAIDIDHIELTVNGRKQSFDVSDQRRGQGKEFFDNFRACWDNAIRKHSSRCPGSSPKGSIGHEDHDHKHHLHLSLPYCPSRGYYAK